MALEKELHQTQLQLPRSLLWADPVYTDHLLMFSVHGKAQKNRFSVYNLYCTAMYTVQTSHNQRRHRAP